MTGPFSADNCNASAANAEMVGLLDISYDMNQLPGGNVPTFPAVAKAQNDSRTVSVEINFERLACSRRVIL